MGWAAARGPGAPSRAPSRAPWGGGGGGRTLLLVAATLCLVRGRGVGPPAPERPVGHSPAPGPGAQGAGAPGAGPGAGPIDGMVYIAVALPGAQDPALARVVHRTLANMTKDFLSVSTLR